MPTAETFIALFLLFMIVFAIGYLTGRGYWRSEAQDTGTIETIGDPVIEEPETEYSADVIAIANSYLKGEIDAADATSRVEDVLESAGIIDRDGYFAVVDVDKIDPIHREGVVQPQDFRVAKECYAVYQELYAMMRGYGRVSGIEYALKQLKETTGES